MKYNVEKLGENLYKVRLPWWYVGYRRLVLALLDIQSRGKTITFVYKPVDFCGESYIVCTNDGRKDE